MIIPESQNNARVLCSLSLSCCLHWAVNESWHKRIVWRHSEDHPSRQSISATYRVQDQGASQLSKLIQKSCSPSKFFNHYKGPYTVFTGKTRCIILLESFSSVFCFAQWICKTSNLHPGDMLIEFLNQSYQLLFDTTGKLYSLLYIGNVHRWGLKSTSIGNLKLHFLPNQMERTWALEKRLVCLSVCAHCL